MAEQGLDDAGVYAGLQKVSGKGVSQTVWGNAFAEAATLPGLAAGGLHGTGGEMQMGAPGRKQPWGAGAQNAEVGAEDFQQARGEHGVTVLAALAVLDAQEHALAVDIGGLERSEEHTSELQSLR